MTPKFKSKEYVLLNNAMHSLTQWTFITPSKSQRSLKIGDILNGK